VKLSDALKFSYERKAWHPTEEGFRLHASDYGLTMHEEAEPGSCIYIDVMKPWVDVIPEQQRVLLRSEGWEPVDPKPVMLVIAEAACDWSIHEQRNDGEDSHLP
jgi:hypothetical protein